MLVDVKVPVFTESVTEGRVLGWKKQVGEAVSRGDQLVDIETDKVVLEVTALNDGVLTEQLRGEGDVVTSEELIGKIDTEAKGAAPAPAAAAATAAVAAAPAASAGASSTELSPAVRKMVAETGVNPADVAGSGKGGRLTKGDVAAHVESGATAARPAGTPAATAPSGPRPEQRVPMTRIRQRIAERLKQTQNTAALLTTFNEVNMQPVMDLRKKHQDEFVAKYGLKLGFMSFFVAAATEALKKFPVINASVDGNDVIYHGYFDIGIAVASERGLVVPVLRDTEQMSLADIEQGIGELAKKARASKLTLEDISGGTFSITNGGTFGSLLSTPIINPPQSAILGMHNIVERPIGENGQIVLRPMMYLALSYDHRIIDGAEAVQFLVHMKKSLEDPARLLLKL